MKASKLLLTATFLLSATACNLQGALIDSMVDDINKAAEGDDGKILGAAMTCDGDMKEDAKIKPACAAFFDKVYTREIAKAEKAADDDLNKCGNLILISDGLDEEQTAKVNELCGL